MIKNVCVFASSSNKLDESFYNDASELGRLIGLHNMNIVYGGSRLGMMYVAAGAVKANGGKIIGIMPKRLHEMGFSNPEDCDEFYLTSGMRERKAKMDEISDAVIALAGGFGTLEEISEMIVQKQLGYNSKPIVLLNTSGFYDGLINFFDTIISKNFAKTEAAQLYYIASGPQDAINYIETYNSQEIAYSGKF